MRRIHENADLQSSAVCFYSLAEPRMKVFFFIVRNFRINFILSVSRDLSIKADQSGNSLKESSDCNI